MMLVIRRESFDRSNEESGDLDLLVIIIGAVGSEGAD